MQTVRLRTENNNCNLSAAQVLLVFDTLIHGEENVEFGYLCGFEKVAILKTCQSGVASCLPIVTGQRIADSLVDTFVTPDAHFGAREQHMFCVRESSDSGVPRH